MRNPEHVRGMQDPKLERRNWRTGVTPTKDSDIGNSARTYMRLLQSAVTHTMALEGLRGDESNPMYQQQQEGLATVRDEVRDFGFNADLFHEVTQIRIRKMKARDAKDKPKGFSERDAFGL